MRMTNLNRSSQKCWNGEGHRANDDYDSILTCLKIPKSSSEFSSNWKNIAKNLPIEKKRVSAELLCKFQNCVSRKTRKISVMDAASTSKSAYSDTGNKYRHKKQRMSEDQEELSVWNVENNRKYTNKLRNYDGDLPKPGSKLAITQRKNHVRLETELTKCIAMDCEFVGVCENGTDDMLARVSLVNLHGHCVYDRYVAPVEEVTDYRTPVSGIRPEHLISGHPLSVVQKEVGDLLRGKILVGHNVKKDLKVLFLSHPKRNIRDTSTYEPFRTVAKTKHPSLRKLASLILGVTIQTGEHDSVIDARATMQLYRTERKVWEKKRSSRKGKSITTSGGKTKS